MVAPVVGAAGAAAGRTAAGAGKAVGAAGKAAARGGKAATNAAAKAAARSTELAGRAASRANSKAARNAKRHALAMVPKGKDAAARRTLRRGKAARRESSGQTGHRYRALRGRGSRRGLVGRSVNMARRGADLTRAGSERGRRTLGAAGRGGMGATGLGSNRLSQRPRGAGAGAQTAAARVGTAAAAAGAWVGRRSARAAWRTGRSAVRRLVPGRRWVKLALVTAVAIVILVVVVSAATIRTFSQNAERDRAAIAAQLSAAATASEGSSLAPCTGDGEVDTRGGDAGPSTQPGEAALSARQVAAVADYGLRRAGVVDPSAEQVQIATAIARGESGWNPGTHNPVPPDNSYGLWQINMLGDLGPDRRQEFRLARDDQLFSPKINAIAMGHISNGGTDWQPWTVYTEGTYRRWMTEVEPIAVEVANLSASQADQIVDRIDSTVPPEVPPIEAPPPVASTGDPCPDGGLGDVGNASLPLDPATYPFDEHRYWYVKTHHDYPAADFPVPSGTPVQAVVGGEVTSVHAWSGRCHEQGGLPCGSNDRCGIGVNITDATGAIWSYCHGTRAHVDRGDVVAAGAVIMDSGNTGNSSGPHLHVGVTIEGEYRCPQYFFAELGADGAPDVQALPTTGCFHVGQGNERVSDGL